MKAKLFFIGILAGFSAFAQKDSSEVRKNSRLSYMQCNIGYAGMPYKGSFMNGFDLHFGAVFNKKIFAGLGVDTYFGSGIPFPQYPDYLTSDLSITYVSLDLEYLHHPDKRFNFSIPLKVSMTQTHYTNLQVGPGFFSYGALYDYDDMFLSLQGGATILVNLSAQMSIGAGANYRMAFNVKKTGSEADFSGYSVIGLLRFKLYSREWHDAHSKKPQEMTPQDNK